MANPGSPDAPFHQRTAWLRWDRKPSVKINLIFDKIDPACRDGYRARNVWGGIDGFAQFHPSAFFQVDQIPVQRSGVCPARLFDGKGLHGGIREHLEVFIEGMEYATPEKEMRLNFVFLLPFGHDISSAV